jgi:hypothetical protein
VPRYESDGVWRGDRSGYDPNLYPSFQPSNIAPAFGVGLESAGVTWAHGRLSYRRVYNTGSVGATEFANGLYKPVSYDGTRISSERLGYALDINTGNFGGLKGGFSYDFYNAKMATIYASYDAYLARAVTVSVDYDYYAPTFDADSIWNFFAGEPMNDLGLRANIEPTDKLSLSAAAHAKIYTVVNKVDNFDSSPNANPTGQPSANYFPASSTQFAEGGNLAARYRWGEGALGVRGAGNFGDQGDRVGGDLYGERTLETRYIFQGRVGAWQWNDKIRPDRDATDIGYMLGIGYRFAARSQALVEWQHDINRLVGQRFRVVLWLTVAVTK